MEGSVLDAAYAALADSKSLDELARDYYGVKPNFLVSITNTWAIPAKDLEILSISQIEELIEKAAMLPMPLHCPDCNLATTAMPQYTGDLLCPKCSQPMKQGF